MSRRTIALLLSVAAFAALGFGQTQTQTDRPQDPDWVKEFARKRIVARRSAGGDAHK